MDARALEGVFHPITKEFHLDDSRRYGRCGHMGPDPGGTEDMVLPTRCLCANGLQVDPDRVATSGKLRRRLGEGRTAAWRSTVSAEIEDSLPALAHRLFSVMPPSFPHAVYTPENCLMVGGQFYTTGNLGRSIEGAESAGGLPGHIQRGLVRTHLP